MFHKKKLVKLYHYFIMRQPNIKYGEVKECDIGGGQIEKLRKYEIGLEIIPAVEDRKEYHMYDGTIAKERINCPDADGIYLLVEQFEHAKRSCKCFL